MENKIGYEETQVVSFRLSDSLIKQIEIFAKEKLDETGRKLSTSKAARMLVFEGLKSIQTNEPEKTRSKSKSRGKIDV